MRKGKKVVKKYREKRKLEEYKLKNGVLKVVGIEMGKMGEKEGMKMKNKGRFGVKVKKVSEKGRNLMDFGEELKV